MCCRCSEVDFDIAVFTNISEEQMRGFNDVETYLVAMNSLFLQLSDPGRQRAVINIDGSSPSTICTPQAAAWSVIGSSP